MNKLNQTEFATVSCLLRSAIFKVYLIYSLHITAVVCKCRVAAVKSRPVLAFNAVIISSLYIVGLNIQVLF